MTRPAMTCPRCGAAMNHEAEKLVQPVTEEEAAALSTAVDGLLELVFACPACGWVDSYRASGDATTSA